MNIVLKNNNGYRWESINNVSFKGYFQFTDSVDVYRHEKAINEFSGITDIEGFVSLLKRIDGSYAVIINNGDTALCAVDRARSMPIYYSTNGFCISDSAEEIRKALNVSKNDVDKDAFFEMAASYYVRGNKTVYGCINQLDLGESALISKEKVLIKRYFDHINSINDIPVESIKKKLTDAAYNTFYKIKEVIGGRPVVLSMSGGYDSRFVGCMLKNVGVEDVSCYTYGKGDNFEVRQSKKNAEALGFRWKCVEMTDDLIKGQLDDVGMAYLRSYEGHDFTAYLQNLPAVRKLHEEGWFKKDSVFLTGACGDMPTGEYTDKRNESIVHTGKTVAENIYKEMFARYEMSDDYKDRWINNLCKRIEEIPIKVSDYQSWQSVFDCIYTGNPHVRWFMHMNSVPSFFGYEWLMPYWNKELLELWYSVPVRYKYNQGLYEDWLLNDICEKYGLNQKKSWITYSKNPVVEWLQYTAGGIINYTLLHCGIPFKRKQDFNNFAPLELELYKRIQSKNLIVYHRAGLMQLLDHFLIEQRYGTENYKKFVESVKPSKNS